MGAGGVGDVHAASIVPQYAKAVRRCEVRRPARYKGAFAINASVMIVDFFLVRRGIDGFRVAVLGHRRRVRARFVVRLHVCPAARYRCARGWQNR